MVFLQFISTMLGSDFEIIRGYKKWIIDYVHVLNKSLDTYT